MQTRIAEAMELDGRDVPAAIQPALPLDERRAYAASEMPAEHLEMLEASLANA